MLLKCAATIAEQLTSVDWFLISLRKQPIPNIFALSFTAGNVPLSTLLYIIGFHVST